MNKQNERLISADKLLEWLNERAIDYIGLGHQGTEAIRYVKWRIEESKDFDYIPKEAQDCEKATKQKLETIIDELGYAFRTGDDETRNIYIQNAIRFAQDAIGLEPIKEDRADVR